MLTIYSRQISGLLDAYKGAGITSREPRRLKFVPGAAIRAECRSEIEIGVVLGRWHAGQVVGEDRAEARARLDARVPVLGRFVVVPRHVAEIVQARQVRRRGDVGDR